MSDIVERLREQADFREAGQYFDDRVTMDIHREAAAEIERLTAALASERERFGMLDATAGDETP